MELLVPKAPQVTLALLVTPEPPDPQVQLDLKALK
jgi:hypothetical protein